MLLFAGAFACGEMLRAQDASAASPPGAAAVSRAPDIFVGESPVGNAERLALDLRSIDLDMHLNADTGAVTTRARMRLRNGSASALTRVALQISSALRWESARLTMPNGVGVRLPVEQFRVGTDADHTGAANELALTLPKPLPPNGEVDLDLYYSGTLMQSGERLLRLGAPQARAAAADWDIVTPAFTGVRGFGNVLWFPVAAPAVLLADGAAFARAVDAQRQRTAKTEMRLSLKLEHTGGNPQMAWFLDRPAELISALRRRDHAESALTPDTSATPLNENTRAAPDPNPDTEQTSIDSAQWDTILLDGRPVSLFVAQTQEATASGGVCVIGADSAVQEGYSTAAEKVAAVLRPWLPAHSAAVLTVLNLDAPGTQAFADGGLLVAPLRAGSTAALAEALAYPLAAASVPQDAPAWLREGLPEFLRLVYLEATAGQERMLAELGAAAGPLREAEAARGMDPASLATCVNPACARTKAAYALVMLRGLVGDAALQQALAAALAPDESAHADPVPRNATRRFEAALTQSSGKDLGWFYRDWFDADKGLPDLQIVQVAPRRIERSVASITAPREKRPVAGPIGAEPEAEPDDPRRAAPTAASRNAVGLPEGSWLVAVEVQNNGDAAAEVPVTVRSAGLQNSFPLQVPAHGRATIRIPFETTPEEVWVNDGTTPEQRAATHHRAISFGSAP